MGFFDKIMGAFGFQSEGKKKKKKGVADDYDKYSNFNLHVKTNMNPMQDSYTRYADNLNIGVEQNLILCEPKSHKDVQAAVDYLRQNQSVLMNLSGLDGDDTGRILDFLSGAIYGLNGSILRYQQDSFILMPEGRKILTPNNKDKKS